MKEEMRWGELAWMFEVAVVPDFRNFIGVAISICSEIAR